MKCNGKCIFDETIGNRPFPDDEGGYICDGKIIVYIGESDWDGAEMYYECNKCYRRHKEGSHYAMPDIEGVEKIIQAKLDYID
jgi:hypothetical protein